LKLIRALPSKWQTLLLIRGRRRLKDHQKGPRRFTGPPAAIFGMLFHRAEGETGNKLALQNEKHRDRW
jgi:hypothetical protein